MKTVKKFLYILSLRERKYAALLLAMMVVMALLEMIGVLSIMPFMTVLINPEIVETNFILNSAYKNSIILGIENKKEFIFLLGIIVFFILIISTAFKFLTNYAQLRFTAGRNFSLAKRLMEGYLHQPYSWFLNRNSADLGKTILADVGIVINNGLSSLFNLIKNFFVMFSILIILILVDPKLTLIVGFTLGFSYLLIYILLRKLLSKMGERRLIAHRWMFQSINEAFGASKEIKVNSLEHAYVKRWSRPAKNLANISVLIQLISQSPRFALEVIAFGGIMLVALYLMAQSPNFTEAVPIIALYTFAGYRLLPSLQQIYTSVTTLNFINPTLVSVCNDLKNLPEYTSKIDKKTIFFNKEISLKNVNYSYPESEKIALKNINLRIPAKKVLGIAGATGSGKTTTIDIILGLLEIKDGSLQVDGQKIDKNNLKSWQYSIGYVPQEIFLTDDTVAANIAFGIDPKEIDQEAVVRSAKIAQLDEFIINELPQKYETYIGERGIRLSGGQRQRIGIARALYHNPQVLILDEATSALDSHTEKQVMKEIKKLGNQITIIIIAHRLTTIKECNSILLLDKGEIIEQGSFEELVRKNENFRAAASSS
tara:strand:- start:6332 stop:8125 length:1794 start_codon:yes stop_codon:yes gene_type:complete